MNWDVLLLALAFIFWSTFCYWFGWMNGRSIGWHEGIKEAKQRWEDFQ